MIASTDYKFVILNNPKTNSDPLERAFYRHANIFLEGSNKNISYRELKEAFGDYFETEECAYFVLVRDPIEQLLLNYQARSRPEVQAKDAEAAARNPEHRARYVGDMSFEDFVRAEGERFGTRHMMKFIQDKRKTVAPLRYYRAEDRDLARAHIAELVGKEVLIRPREEPEVPNFSFDRAAVEAVPFVAGSYEYFNQITFQTAA